jgi:hypothetical protein
MGKAVPADIVLRKTGPRYRATPPVYTAHPDTKPTVLIRNLTGSPVKVWSPQGALLDTPREIPDTDEYPFPINPETRSGNYAYTAYVVGAEEFVEGNSPPEVIIDR